MEGNIEMNDKVESRIVKLLCENFISEGTIQETVILDCELDDVGINSIQFVKLAVAIEVEFNIGFGNEFLDNTKFKTINDIVNYVKRLKLHQEL